MVYRTLIAVTAALACMLVGGTFALDAQPFWNARQVARAAGGGGAFAGVSSLLASLTGAKQRARALPALHLRVPDHAPLLVRATPAVPPRPRKHATRAHAFAFVSKVLSRPGKRPSAKGYVRRGTVLLAGERVRGPGCRGGWYQLAQGGVVCHGDGFAVYSEPHDVIKQVRPDVRRAMPFRYAKVISNHALRFYRVPSEREELDIARSIERDQRLPEVVEERLDGIYLLALAHEKRVGEREFWSTVRGRVVYARDIEHKPEPGMRGVLLSASKALPYAFVYGRQDEPAPVYRLGQDGSLTAAGIADNHARIRVLRELTVGGREFVVGPNNLALSRDHVRLARRARRPADVSAGAKWIDVDLTEQALVAYEGDRPVFATLISSGKGKEHATPTGLYRIHEKHISTTMSGADPEAGVYEVEEVPWTLYYKDSFALHGAYWHDEFGQTRSHGCTNISPIDARWLFYWTDGKVPAGWNALRNIEGTYVYFHGEADVDA